MADGEWTIRQWNPTGDKLRTEKIRVWVDPETERVVPHSSELADGLMLLWPDGHYDIYPWCSIVKAEYRPPKP